MINYFEKWLCSGWNITEISADVEKMEKKEYTSQNISAIANADVECSGAVCEENLIKTLVAAYYGEAVRFGNHKSADAAKEMFLSNKFPTIYYEFNHEYAVCRQLCEAIDGEIPAFVAENRFISNAMAAYGILRAHEMIKQADIAVAMNLEAIRGEIGAFDARLHELGRPFPGQIDCAQNVRRLVENSDMITDEGRYAYGYDTHPRIQDAICIRATPQTHGAVRDFCYWCEEQINDIAARDAEKDNYITEYTLNALVTALADLAHISERRAFRLNDTRLSYGLPMNLVPSDVGINHGFPVVQSNQAALVAELKLLVLPNTAVKSGTGSDAYYAVCKLLRAIPLLSKTLSVEFLMCAQAMDIVEQKIPSFHFGTGTLAVRNKIRETVDLLTENRFVSPLMNETDRLVMNGTLILAAENAVGKLK